MEPNAQSTKLHKIPRCPLRILVIRIAPFRNIYMVFVVLGTTHGGMEASGNKLGQCLRQERFQTTRLCTLVYPVTALFIAPIPRICTECIKCTPTPMVIHPTQMLLFMGLIRNGHLDWTHIPCRPILPSHPLRAIILPTDLATTIHTFWLLLLWRRNPLILQIRAIQGLWCLPRKHCNMLHRIGPISTKPLFLWDSRLRRK